MIYSFFEAEMSFSNSLLYVAVAGLLDCLFVFEEQQHQLNVEWL